MMKKLLSLLAILMLCAVYPAAAEEAVPPVTAEELYALADSVRTEALASQPLNDPSAENSLSEDGTLFQYENVRIYADGTELASDTPVNALVFEDSEGPVFRGIGIDTMLDDLLAAFPQENAELTGDRNEAVLYLSDTASGGFVYGRILRDGQRVTSVEYGELLPEGEQFHRAAVTYTLTSGLVTAIRMEGLNPTGPELTDGAHAEELRSELKEQAGRGEYRMVRTSRNGLELTPFCEDDLSFSGFSYLSLQPAALPGAPESELIDNEDGTWLLRCDGDGYEAVFRCDEQGENATIMSFSIQDNETEGPRCVRLDDLFSDDFCRFRSGENEMDENLHELLYGSEDTAPWGLAVYDPDDMSLRYVTDTSAGSQVELLLRYENNLLKEIILQTI